MSPVETTNHIAKRRIDTPGSYFTTVSFAVLSLAILMHGTTAQWLQYDRSAILAGQLWRVVTCHLTHWNLDHWIWDAAMFVILGALCERADRRQTIVCLLASALGISAVLWVFASDMQTYRGLSGIDTALFTLLATRLLADAWARRERLVLAAIGAALLGLIAKTIYEIATGSTFFVDSTAADFVPIPLAHLVGAAIGIATVMLGYHRKYQRRHRGQHASASRPESISGALAQDH